MSGSLTNKQRAILLYIMRHDELYGAAPTAYGMAKVFGITAGAMWFHMEILRRKGYNV